MSWRARTTTAASTSFPFSEAIRTSALPARAAGKTDCSRGGKLGRLAAEGLGVEKAGPGIRELRWVRPTTFSQADDLVMAADLSCLVKCRNPNTIKFNPEAVG